MWQSPKLGHSSRYRYRPLDRLREMRGSRAMYFPPAFEAVCDSVWSRKVIREQIRTNASLFLNFFLKFPSRLLFFFAGSQHHGAQLQAPPRANEAEKLDVLVCQGVRRDPQPTNFNVFRQVGTHNIEARRVYFSAVSTSGAMYARVQVHGFSGIELVCYG